ncbi:MAG: CGNR zinc finger domain-containing protein [Pseudomonadota bacterium]
MRKKLKISTNRVQGKYAGLRFIASWINPFSVGVGPIRPILDKLVLILQTMTGQLPVKKHMGAPKRSFFDYELTPSQRKEIASPAFAIELFNDLVKEYPIPLKLKVQKRSGKIEVFPDRSELNLIQETLLLLWENYFKNEGWHRLKRCPTCEKWYVDESKNRTKEWCSYHCKWSWWTRARRKEAGHGKGKRQVRKRKR